MRFANVVVFGAALPPLASAANFVRGNRVSEDTFKYDIEKCTDEKPCSLYLVRLSDMERVATIFEKQAGTGFTARIQNVPSGTYIFQATGGEDGKTTTTTQFTYNTNLATTGTGTVTSSSPATSSATESSAKTSPKTTSSLPGSTTASSNSGSTAPGTKEPSSTKTSTAPLTTTTAPSSGTRVTFGSWGVLGVAVVMGWLLI
ncbi:Phosphatidylinositol (PI) 3-kinase [Metarhizium acridum]|uniref:Phosphatidylinositol (PI) 3-kinase n=1 Tax=Metarhizium acridum TaxID=92637 RepID=UPI001C6CCEB4|nr:Phosphatidylinositol (PI) 3-kinase [Metarhizium acridum]